MPYIDVCRCKKECIWKWTLVWLALWLQGGTAVSGTRFEHWMKGFVAFHFVCSMERALQKAGWILIWHSKWDTGLHLISHVAGQAHICFSISCVSPSRCPSPSYNTRSVLCMCVLGSSQRTYNCYFCSLRRCGTDRDRAESAGYSHIERGAGLLVYSDRQKSWRFFSLFSVSHSFLNPNHVNRPNSLFQNPPPPPHAIDWPPTWQLAAPFLFPAGSYKVAQPAPHCAKAPQPSKQGSSPQNESLSGLAESQVAVTSSCSCIMFCAPGKKGNVDQTSTERRTKATKRDFQQYIELTKLNQDSQPRQLHLESKMQS